MVPESQVRFWGTGTMLGSLHTDGQCWCAKGPKNGFADRRAGLSFAIFLQIGSINLSQLLAKLPKGEGNASPGLWRQASAMCEAAFSGGRLIYFLIMYARWRWGCGTTVFE